ncbi:MAG: alpha/beta hydrolase [Kangiellaceae bacterium]|nr:alpha/beta hydrolase [Kangiellaceae bacterium]MCW8997636.1 alpha/beta hydrolase [Kangiellaceae bacterium]
MKSLIIFVVLVYLLLCGLMFVFQRSLLFFPQSSKSLAGVESIQLKNKGQLLNGWVLNPSNAKAIIYYGGNAEAIEANINDFYRWFPEYTIYLIPYRGYGLNSGEPTEAALYTDALAVFDHVTAIHQSISLIGRSLGSGVATYVAVNREVEKIALVTPYDSIVEVAKTHYPIFPISWLARDRFESNKRAASIDIPTLILIAEKDQVIPVKHSEALAELFSSEILQKITVRNARHNDIHIHPTYNRIIVEFFKSTPLEN